MRTRDLLGYEPLRPQPIFALEIDAYDETIRRFIPGLRGRTDAGGP